MKQRIQGAMSPTKRAVVVTLPDRVRLASNSGAAENRGADHLGDSGLAVLGGEPCA